MKGGLAAQCAVAIALRKAGAPAGRRPARRVGGGRGVRGRRRDARRAPARDDRRRLRDRRADERGRCFRASRGGHFFDVVCRAGDPSAYFSKDEVVSPAVPMGRLLGWIDAWTAKRRRVDRGETYRDFPDPAPVQVLAVEANRFDPDIPWSVPLEARVRVYFQFLPHEDVGRARRRDRGVAPRLCRRGPVLPGAPARGAAARGPAARGARARGRSPLDALPARGGARACSDPRCRSPPPSGRATRS